MADTILETMREMLRVTPAARMLFSGQTLVAASAAAIRLFPLASEGAQADEIFGGWAEQFRSYVPGSSLLFFITEPELHCDVTMTDCGAYTLVSLEPEREQLGIQTLQAIADRLRPEWRSLPEKEKKEFYDGIQHTVRKCAHFTEFALLGISLRLCLESWRGSGKNNGLPSWGGGTGYAALDELHQLMVDGRSGQWTDILLDSAGVFCGVLLTALVLKRLFRGQAARTK